MKRKILRILLLIFAVVMMIACVSCEKEEEIDTTVKKLEIDYDMTYCGVSLKDLSALFDEQAMDPATSMETYEFPSSYLLPYDYDNDGDIDQTDYDSKFEITVNFEVKKHIDHVYLFYKGTGQTITIQAGTPFKYEHTITYTVLEQGWNRVDVNYDTQYLNFIFTNGPAQPPYEILAYGYDLGETPKAVEKTRENKTMGYLLGMNGHSQANSTNDIECVGYYRDYKYWTYGYKPALYPGVASSFSAYDSDMKIRYAGLLKKGTESVPCFQFDLKTFPAHVTGSDKNLPESYVMYSEFLYQYILRFGYNESNTKELVKIVGGVPQVNLNLVKWVELGNEPNGEDATGYTPYQLAALQSATYDGHCNTITSPSGSGVGVKNADPDIKVAMAGLAGIQTRYIKAMSFWLTSNRPDGSLAIDAFNVHTYCRKIIEYNGFGVEVGISPEAADLAGQLEALIEFRDKYHPNVEVWLTEFGWDTNQSYLTEGSSHAYGPYTGRQVQAMWLARSYFILSSIGVDRAAMYMCLDVGSEESSVGKYGTSGVITVSGEKKDSYYYLYTLKSVMYDMYFKEIVESGNEDVWVYKFEDGKGKTCYAVWCPTSDNVRVDGYQLNIGKATNATLTEMKYGEIAGASSALAISDGKVSVNVSECPILVVVE